RAIKYPRDYVGFTGKNMSPGEPIEGEPWPDCAIQLAVENIGDKVQVYPNPVEDKLTIKLPDTFAPVSVKLLTAYGSEVKSVVGYGEVVVDTSGMDSGFFVAIINNSSYKIIKLK
ncbi:MAG: hypothetical protein C0490_16540, partial [Marivirga sp.]|nr:hypothetical protein [Marivirga sp.]